MKSICATLLFADGVNIQVEANEGELLIDAAKRNGLTLFSDCSMGKCGTCVAKLVSGEVALGEYDPAVLPDDERSSGAILSCIAHMKTDCIVEYPYDASDASVEVGSPVAATVIGCGPVADEIWRLDVEVEQPLSFIPGQYVRIRTAPEGPWRSYSMANAPGENRLSFYVRLVLGGEFSTWLKEKAQAGDAIELEGPRGCFFLRTEDRPRVFVAGGSGLAPFLSMLRHLYANGDKQKTTLIVGARTGRHLFAREEIAAMAAANPNLRVAYAVESNPVDGARVGYPTDLLPELGLSEAERVYVCGPPPMVEAVKKSLSGIGLDKAAALYERFN